MKPLKATVLLQQCQPEVSQHDELVFFDMVVQYLSASFLSVSRARNNRAYSAYWKCSSTHMQFVGLKAFANEMNR